MRFPRIRSHGLCHLLVGLILLGAGPRLSLAGAPAVTALGDYQNALHAPGRLAIDPGSHLFITEPQANQVIVKDIFGRTVDVQTGFASPLAIAIDGTGTLYLGEEGTGSVSVFDPQWNLLSKLGQGDGEFLLPNHIALVSADGSNAVYVADSRAGQIKAYINGTLTLAFGTPGTNPGEFDFPTGVFITTNQELYVVDQNNDRVQVFTLNGIFLRQFTLETSAGGMGLFPVGGRSQGVTVDTAGRVYVADTFQGFVRVFDTQGNFLASIGTFGSARGQFRSPTGLTIDRYNRLLVASSNNSRVEILGLDDFYHFVSSQGDSNAEWKTSVTYSVIAGGAGPFTYQWQKNGQDLTDSAKVTGSTTATLTLSFVTLDDIGSYSVVVSSPSGIVTGSSTYLMVNPSRYNTGTLIMIN